MGVSIYSLLLALVLGCNVTAGTILKVSEEKQRVTLSCPRPVEGTATWSREINGSKVDLITADSEKDIRHNDQRKRYSSQADKFKSLVIGRAVVSDSGTYFCNNESAAELTVIPSGTIIRNATERTSIALECPPGVGGSDGPTWSREVAGKQKQIRSPVSTVDKTLTITEVQVHDSGLYYCDGKPAVYLRVIKAQKTAALVLQIVVPVFLLIIIIIVCYLTWRCRCKTRENEEGCPVYEEIPEGSVYQPSNGLSTQNDPTYSTINDLPPTANKNGSSQLTSNYYSLLEKPKVVKNQYD